MTIGERLRMIRKKENLLLKEAGSACGISAQTLSRYENNDRKPDYEFLGRFVKHFNVSTDWLLFGETPIYRAADLDRDVKESFIELSDLIRSKKIPDLNIPSKLDFTKKISDDIPENYLLLIKYMLKYSLIRKGIFQFFYLLLKPLIDTHPKLSESDQN
ncbi:MAG: helix-turn-helix domain-containing protein [Candidatus Aminicenantes bacterium]|nr:helix-turn-helix domain-containing protein [Candidatus Aminicenantes bacterium]NIM83672.1 helix-turn-helix domain-containing protein [Candidatus Aminicenantes bacterium]NIN23097.1 helix-turn-helix domain-containing protein [Candidatus Aminicenantes bacterium]NIN46824.1 helix-turn-helix domain-containing protein [Candidatus Aminicenantes bacterium]NIN89746.1 helix-turn-helix domain-containing protein [Candidatus Aminicenantes bacterium]